MRSFPVPPLVAALACLASCLNISQEGTTLATEPPGARVHVDGRDSGWVTPCKIALDVEEEHVVTLQMDGFEPSEIVLQPLERSGIVTWQQGVNGVRATIRFPILLPVEDFFLPLRESDTLAPGRVFVRLRPSGTR